MKIVTVNVPESYIEAINRLVGEDGLYPSRSELVRVAVRDFLIKELKMMKALYKYRDESDIEEYDDDSIVKVPIEKKDKNGDTVRDFKTYKIIRRLEL